MKTYKVKELAEKLNVTVRLIHHYDALGIVKPSIRKPTGYRLYTEDDIDIFNKALVLRDCGFSLKEIKEHVKDDGIYVEILANQEIKLETQLSKIKRSIETLRSLYSGEKFNEWQLVSNKPIEDVEI
jgi:DNA-binding transcriptional MerR regulator